MQPLWLVLFVLVTSCVHGTIDPYLDLTEQPEIRVPPPKPTKPSPLLPFSSSSESESLRIHIVPHSHVDHGWLRTTDKYEEVAFEILNSVTNQLDVDPKRRFAWAEIWYFRRWFEQLGQGRREKVRRLVREKRFEFVGGGLVMHDETQASGRIVTEEILEGHAFIEQTFGVPAPKIAWQIDAAGHSDATPGFLTRLGYNILVMNRVHFRTKQRLRKGQHLEFIWRGPLPHSAEAARGVITSPAGSPVSLVDTDENHQIFAHLLPSSYASPDGYDFEKIGSRAVTQPRGRATKLLQYAREASRYFRTHHVMILWGDDLRFSDAEKEFTNMDKILAEISAENPSIKIGYSSPSEYFEAIQRTAASQSLRFPLYLGDFLPYADSGDAYWSGSYSARPGLKRISKQLESKLFWSSAMFSLARARASLYGSVPRVSAIEMDTGRVVADDARPAPSWGVGLFRSLIFAKRQAMLIGAHHHAANGNARETVVKDWIKRAKLATESAIRVGIESLSFLLMRRKSHHDAPGPHVRAPIKAWSPNDALQLKDDNKQWPLIFSNDQAQWKRELVVIRLDCAWSVAKRVKVIDGTTGAPVASQVHKTVVSSSSDDQGGWNTDINLYVLIEIPPLGFNTYFISSSSGSERLQTSSGVGVAANTFAAPVLLQVYDLFDGRVVAPRQIGSTYSATAAEGVKVSPTTPYSESKDGGASCLTIDNDRVSVDMDCTTMLIKSMTEKKTKKRVLLRQQFRVHETSRAGGVLFRPDRLESTVLEVGEKGRITVAIARGPLVQEVQILGDGVSQVVRLIRAPHGFDSAASLALEGHVFASHAVAGTTPDVDTVVRYSTDLKTGGTFFTDNPLNAMRERKGQIDAPLAANFFPCAGSMSLKSIQTPVAPSILLGLVLSQPCACTGSASISSGGVDFGTIELVLHRNPTNDDGRGLGEGLRDFGVSRMDTFLYFDSPEAFFVRRSDLMARIGSVSSGEGVIAQMDYTSFLSPLLSREAWLSRFLPSASYLKKSFANSIRLVSMFPRDETSDDVQVRLENVSPGGETVKFDLSNFFNSDEYVVAGAREYKSSAVTPLPFACSERTDDLRGGGTGGGGGDDSGSAVGSAFTLSEHAQKEAAEGEMDVEEQIAVKSKRSSSTAAPFKDLSSQPGTAVAGGNVLPSSPSFDPKWKSTPNPFELRNSESQLFIVGLLALPDEWAPTLPKPKQPVGSTTLGKSGLSAASGTKSTKTAAATTVLPGAATPTLQPTPMMTTTTTILGSPRATAAAAALRNTGATATGGSGSSSSDHRGKSLSSLRGESVAEEKRAAALDIRSKRLQQNVDELLQELELFQDIDEGVDKKAAVDELSRAEEQLVEGSLQLKESREKIVALRRELDHVEALDELRSRHHTNKRRGDYESSATLHGVFAGAGGMLVFVIAAQWLLTGRRRHQQAFVPVRYVPVHHHTPGPGFAVPVKRL